MDTEALQKVLKTVADPTRVRILALLEREELAVQELMEVLGMAQSRVSRHLGILRETALVKDRRDGTYVFYRMAGPLAGLWQEAWDLVKRNLGSDPSLERDGLALGRLLESRAARSRAFFDTVGLEWDALRKVFNDEALRASAISRLVPRGLTVVDIGTGTGILAGELALRGLRVIGVDHSPRMVDAARQRLEERGIEGVELRQGEADALPLGIGEADAAFAHMVLHYVPSPGDAIAEVGRILRPGGIAVVVDFVHHEAEWMRPELGVLWLGFARDELASWFETAGLIDFDYEVQPELSRGRDLPATFIATGRLGTPSPT